MELRGVVDVAVPPTVMPIWNTLVGSPVSGKPGAQTEEVEGKEEKESREERGEREDLLSVANRLAMVSTLVLPPTST